jgi:chromosome segregation ATPase
MDRPTIEQVEKALAWVEYLPPTTNPTAVLSAEILAAEVRALRKEFGECEAEFRAPLRAELSECRAQLEKARGDVVAASGELLVEVPEPGTDMARVMIANALMRRERNLFRDASEAAELRLVELRAAANEYRDQSDQLDHAIEECAHYKEGYEREEGAARAYRAQVGVLCATIARVEAFIPKLKTRAQELRDTHYEYCAASEIVDAADEIEDALKVAP